MKTPACAHCYAPAWAILILLALHVAAPAHANVMPEAVVLVNVQPFEWTGPGMGPPPAIETCEEIQQYTDQLGRMEFDLFIYPVAYAGDDLTIHSLEASLEWPNSWVLDRWEPASQGHGTLGEQGSGAVLSLAWTPPRTMTHEVFLFARVVLEAPDAGALDFDGDVPVLITLDQNTFEMDAWGIQGRVGFLCGDCDWPCGSGGQGCTPVFTPEVAQVTLPPESSTQISFTVEALSGSPQFPCTVTGSASEPWMEVEVTPLAWPDYRVDVDISSTGMTQGFYEGWVMASSRCTACATVLLNVREAAGIEDDEPARHTTWGRLKNDFR